MSRQRGNIRKLKQHVQPQGSSLGLKTWSSSVSSSFQLLLLGGKTTVSFKEAAAFSASLLRPLDQLVEGDSSSSHNKVKRHLLLLFVMTHDQDPLMDGPPASLRLASFLIDARRK